MLRDGVIGSLVPLISAAALAGIDVTQTAALVAMCEVILGADVAAAGRRLDTIGVTSGDVDSARRLFDSLMNGAG